MTKFFTRVLTGAFSVFVLTFSAQQPKPFCGTEIPSAEWEQELSRLISENKLQNSAAKGQVPLYVIPVIIHVLHGGEAVGTYPNLAQAQLVSQVQVLNNDFAGIGYNSGKYPAQAFSSWAAANVNISPNSLDDFSRVGIADCRIEFCLAKYDTLGNLLAEPGIDRVDYNSKGWPNPAAINSYSQFKSFIDGTVKPGTIWNVSKYLNIWVTDENIGAIGLLGYATFPKFANLSGLPSSGSATTDGFWCYAKAFGSVDIYPTGSYLGSNNRGRTCTHEIGHYLGLRHIWGDGVCATDYCIDTPPASDKNYGNHNYPYKTANCANNAPDGEMFMNFMDYTDDVAKYMFTQDQAIRMQTAMANSPYRKFLGTHNLCTVVPVAATSTFVLPSSVCGNGAIITPTNHSKGTPPPTYTWNVSGGGVVTPHANSPYLAINLPTAGIYTITLTTDNGTVTTSSKVFTVNPFPVVSVTGAPSIVCDGMPLTLTASGATWYTWQPMGVTSNTYAYISNGPFTFSVIGTGAGNCKSTTVMTVNSGICTSVDEHNIQAAFNLYPNPASGYITLKTAQAATRVINVTDLTGRLVYTTTQSTEKLIIDVSSWEAGVYFVTSLSENGQSYTQRLVKE